MRALTKCSCAIIFIPAGLRMSTGLIHVTPWAGWLLAEVDG